MKNNVYTKGNISYKNYLVDLSKSRKRVRRKKNIETVLQAQTDAFIAAIGVCALSFLIVFILTIII